MPPPGGGRVGSFVNTARDSTIGAQIGGVDGNVNVFNGDVKNTYLVAGDASPEEKLKVAISMLNGNIARPARELIEEVIKAGYATPEVSYYWSLAILSGRYFDHLDMRELESLASAIDMARSPVPNEWSQAVSLIFQLLDCFKANEASDFERVMAEFDNLRQERREEVRRHLDMILEGGTQDRLDAEYAEEIDRLRAGDHRPQRVWKFFEPAPAEPRHIAVADPVLPVGRQVMACCGAASAAAGLLFSLIVIGSADIAAALAAGLLAVAGGCAFGRFGFERLAAGGRLADRCREFGRPTTAIAEAFSAGSRPQASAPAQADEERTRREQFGLLVRLCFDLHFSNCGPESDDDRQKWNQDTSGIKASLAKQVSSLYADPPTGIGSVNWLIRWYAEDIAQRWKSGHLFDFERELAPSALAGAACYGGIAVLASDFLFIAVELLLQHSRYGLIAAALMVLGGCLLANSRVAPYLVRQRRVQHDRADREKQEGAEQIAYKEWQEVLADRPSDDEMGRWLDYDKMHLKSSALRSHGIVNRDIVAHAVLAEPLPPCLGVRVVYGPWRYTSYQLRLFLLTSGGVYQTYRNLDFATGRMTKMYKNVIGYDKISSYHEYASDVVVVSGDGEAKQAAERRVPADGADQTVPYSHEYRLKLADGNTIEVRVAPFDEGFIDRLREDPEKLLDLTLDTSGIRETFRILQSVAGEGKEWIAQERLRRDRRLSDLKQKTATKELTPGRRKPLVTGEIRGAIEGRNGAGAAADETDGEIAEDV